MAASDRRPSSRLARRGPTRPGSSGARDRHLLGRLGLAPPRRRAPIDRTLVDPDLGLRPGSALRWPLACGSGPRRDPVAPGRTGRPATAGDATVRVFPEALFPEARFPEAVSPGARRRSRPSRGVVVTARRSPCPRPGTRGAVPVRASRALRRGRRLSVCHQVWEHPIWACFRRFGTTPDFGPPRVEGPPRFRPKTVRLPGGNAGRVRRHRVTCGVVSCGSPGQPIGGESATKPS